MTANGKAVPQWTVDAASEIVNTYEAASRHYGFDRAELGGVPEVAAIIARHAPEVDAEGRTPQQSARCAAYEKQVVAEAEALRAEIVRLREAMDDILEASSEYFQSGKADPPTNPNDPTHWKMADAIAKGVKALSQ